MRDDLLGIWDTKELGKSPAGDLYRRKKTLPVIHALAHATSDDRAALEAFLTSAGRVRDDRVVAVLAILERTDARQAAVAELRARSAGSRRLLEAIATGPGPAAAAAADALAALVDYIESDLVPAPHADS